jgi:hypothetical protein
MRRLKSYVPVFMIALMVQILAPISVSWAFAAAVSDPLAAAEICQGHLSSTSTPGEEGGQPQTHDASCLICCGLHAGAPAFSTPEPTVWVAPYRYANVVAWRDDVPQLADSCTGSNAKARAPPSIS